MKTSWEGKFPKFLEEELDPKSFYTAMMSKTLQISRDPSLHLPVIHPDGKFITALSHAFNDGSLIRGLADIQKYLHRESVGLRKLERIDQASAPKRISRLLLISSDGSPRFLHEIAETLIRNAPRTAGLILDCSSSDLSRFLSGKPGIVKAVLANHRNAVSSILLALGRRSL